ncbi:PHB depolymerase family esterase [Aurantimonas sp. Leaf443]|uniref:extracellular catalytic domain type 1 short-chain-length polyhydroxyalkanoate depolymerase n=1 Tax=Aurantimonas sp. Leaf443 TaxID=1736378 RepID=UPI0006FD6755|nr:PHB depolymerase family esterase [Aurantimonas sp. Leaf443]KQT84089.1 hypothetical protein ASG48_12035 [Aurantimonas sp. Leaf443]
MSPISKAALLEATRLTRAGRLDEALAALTGRAAPAVGTERDAPAGQPRMPHAGPDLSALGDMAARLGAGLGAGLKKMPFELPGGLGAKAPAPEPKLAPGARFESLDHTGMAGTRAYRLYVPSTYREAPMPLVVMLHGCTQSPEDFAAGTRMNEVAEEHGFLVAWPAQSKAANASKCWNWFKPEDQGRERGEPSLIAGIVRDIERDFAVEAGRVFVAGLSAGGAQAAIMGAAYPDLFRAVGVHSGLACGAASDMGSAFSAMRNGAPARPRAPGAAPIPTIVFHGDEDATVHPANAQSVAHGARGPHALEAREETGTAPGGRAYSRRVETDGSGRVVLETWTLHGGPHAWSGGSAAGTYTDPAGPDASRAMARFFLAQPHG